MMSCPPTQFVRQNYPEASVSQALSLLWTLSPGLVLAAVQESGQVQGLAPVPGMVLARSCNGGYVAVVILTWPPYLAVPILDGLPEAQGGEQVEENAEDQQADQVR